MIFSRTITITGTVPSILSISLKVQETHFLRSMMQFCYKWLLLCTKMSTNICLVWMSGMKMHSNLKEAGLAFSSFSWHLSSKKLKKPPWYHPVGGLKKFMYEQSTWTNLANFRNRKNDIILPLWIGNAYWHLSVLKVSSKLMSAGLIAAIMAVFELPPDKNETEN